MSSVQSVTYVPGLYPPPPAKGREALGTHSFLRGSTWLRSSPESNAGIIYGLLRSQESKGIQGPLGPW
jgi:hypothetical protein